MGSSGTISYPLIACLEAVVNGITSETGQATFSVCMAVQILCTFKNYVDLVNGASVRCLINLVKMKDHENT